MRDAVAAYGRRTIPDCRFVVIDSAGKTALAGSGTYREDGTMLIALRGRLPAGHYTVSVALYPYGNTVEVRRIPYDAPGTP